MVVVVEEIGIGVTVVDPDAVPFVVVEDTVVVPAG